MRLRVAIGFFFQAEDGIRDLVRSRGLGDVYKRQVTLWSYSVRRRFYKKLRSADLLLCPNCGYDLRSTCLLYTSDAADERSSVDLGGRRIIKKKTDVTLACLRDMCTVYRTSHIIDT